LLGEVRDHYDKPLPKYVEKELRDYLECGLLQHGFAKAVCKACGRTILAAFSCKRRGSCPLCFVVTQLVVFTSNSEMYAADGSFAREFNRLRCVARQSRHHLETLFGWDRQTRRRPGDKRCTAAVMSLSVSGEESLWAAPW